MISIYDDKLTTTFHFSKNDIDANRNGELSPVQKRHLWLRFIANLGWLGTLTLVNAVIGLIALFFLQITATLWLWLLAAIFGYLLWRQGRNTRDVIALGIVEHVRGVARIGLHEQATGHHGLKSSVWRLSINNMTFNVNRHQRKAIQEGGDYTVYYLLGLGVILSVERHDQPTYPFTG